MSTDGEHHDTPGLDGQEDVSYYNGTRALLNVSYANSSDYVHMLYWQNYWLLSAEYVWWNSLKTYAPPVLALVGTLGNSLGLLALTRKQVQRVIGKKHASIGFYFSVLCMANAVMLLTEYFLPWLSTVTNTVEVSSLADPVCKIWSFLFKLVVSFSSWITTTCLVDRFLVMWNPVRAHDVCTLFIAKIVTVWIFVGLVSVNIHAMWTMLLQPIPHSTQYWCSLDPTLGYFQQTVWPWVEVAINSYLPVLLCFLFTLLLIVGCLHPHVRGDADETQAQLTRAAVATGVAYTILQLPAILMFFVNAFNTGRNVVTEARLVLAFELCQIMHHLNNAIFFLLLFACLPALRCELKALALRAVKPITRATGSRSGGHAGELQQRARPADNEQLLSPGGGSIEICPNDVTTV